MGIKCLPCSEQTVATRCQKKKKNRLQKQLIDRKKSNQVKPVQETFSAFKERRWPWTRQEMIARHSFQTAKSEDYWRIQALAFYFFSISSGANNALFEERTALWYRGQKHGSLQPCREPCGLLCNELPMHRKWNEKCKFQPIFTGRPSQICRRLKFLFVLQLGVSAWAPFISLTHTHWLLDVLPSP